MGLTKKCHFSKNVYTLGSLENKWVACIHNFLHSECSPMHPVHTTFEKLAKYYLGKKLGRFL